MPNSDPLDLEPGSPETPAQPDAAPPAPRNETIEDQLNGLRRAIVILLGGLVLTSVCFGMFMYKQNNLLIAQVETQTRVLSQNEPLYQATRQRLGAFLQELTVFAQTHNDVVPILVKHNFVRVQQPPATTIPAPTPAPAPAAR